MPDDNETKPIPVFQLALAAALAEFRHLEQVYLDDGFAVHEEGSSVWESEDEYQMAIILMKAKQAMMEEMLSHAVALNRLIVQHNAAVRTCDEYTKYL